MSLLQEVYFKEGRLRGKGGSMEWVCLNLVVKFTYSVTQFTSHFH